jgi:hypothetical protein
MNENLFALGTLAKGGSVRSTEVAPSTSPLSLTVVQLDAAVDVARTLSSSRKWRTALGYGYGCAGGGGG